MLIPTGDFFKVCGLLWHPYLPKPQELEIWALSICGEVHRGAVGALQ